MTPTGTASFLCCIIACFFSIAMETIISVLGIASAAIISAIYYARTRRIALAALWLAVLALGLGTPLLYFIMPVALGALANSLLYKKLGKNWLAFVLSLIGMPVTAALLAWARPYYIPPEINVAGLGAVIAALGLIFIYVLIIAGSTALYFLSTAIYSIARWARKKHG